MGGRGVEEICPTNVGKRQGRKEGRGNPSKRCETNVIYPTGVEISRGGEDPRRGAAHLKCASTLSLPERI